MAIGFVLLSTMGPDTSTLLQSVCLMVLSAECWVLGAGIGMCTQLLVLIVQDTADFADLGVHDRPARPVRYVHQPFGHGP